MPGSANIVDFLTKWVSAESVEMSLQYLTGAGSALAGVARACVEEFHAMAAIFGGWDEASTES